MPALSQLWSILVRNRTRLIALLLIVSFFAPQPANAQFGFLLGLINIVTSGMNTLNNVMTSVNNTLRNVIGPILQQINSIMTAVQQIMSAIFDFQRNVIYPQQAIDRARALVGQVQGIYATIRGIWNVIVRSATLPNPRQLESVLLSRDAGQIGAVGGNFSAVYTPLPAAAEAHPAQRDLIDSSDAAAQAAMKRAIAIDAIADQELAAAEQMMTALQSTAPGTAEMIGAQAGAWLVRSHAYTQQALAELMRIRTIELATQSARMKESARFTRETRNKLTELNK
ncbi:MAG TPA: hypothetical protein PLF84_00305 [Bryobacteraceae bacterium]|nr:hypothetical protein [Bryobacterales bacterium]HRJ17444.1 hypothetical protein [Bryobacteraceae bacterium]